MNNNYEDHIFHLVHDFLCGDDWNVIRVKGKTHEGVANRFWEWLKQDDKLYENWTKEERENLTVFTDRFGEDGIFICNHDKCDEIQHQDLCIITYDMMEY